MSHKEQPDEIFSKNLLTTLTPDLLGLSHRARQIASVAMVAKTSHVICDEGSDAYWRNVFSVIQDLNNQLAVDLHEVCNKLDMIIEKKWG